MNSPEVTASSGDERTSPVLPDGITAGVALAQNTPRENVSGGEVDEHGLEGSTACQHTYLVLGRLFKLHPDFDAGIEKILSGDPKGCVILIHETTDEEWTRAVWDRLTHLLVPQGKQHYHNYNVLQKSVPPKSYSVYLHADKWSASPRFSQPPQRARGTGNAHLVCFALGWLTSTNASISLYRHLSTMVIKHAGGSLELLVF